MRRCSVIDIGTNSLLYLTVERSPEADFKVISQKHYNNRLGKGMDRQGIINLDAVEQCIEILFRLKERAREDHADKVMVVGTEVFRKAENQRQVLEKIRSNTGLEVRVLSEQEEAEASFTGAVTASREYKLCNVVDIGGGSTEIILGKDNEIFDLVSLPVGAVNLTERYVFHDPPGEQEIANLKNAVIREIKKQVDSSLLAGKRLIGVGGTITTTAAVHFDLPQYDAGFIQGKKISFSGIKKIITNLSSIPLEKRKKLLEFDPQRADIISAGGIILVVLMQTGQFQHISISDLGLRFGLALKELTS